MAYGLYLYGILPASEPHQVDLQGLDKQPVQTHQVDNFVFLYSEAQQERYLASRKNLLGHEQVLERAMEMGHHSLLPLQFGLIVTDWETVRQQLTLPREDVLNHLFDKLRDRREVGVKVFWEADTELETLMQEDHTLRAERDRLEGKSLSMDEIVRIGQAIEKALEDRKQKIISTFRETLNAFAVEVVENDALTEAMIYNSAYLIPWDAESHFGEQVEALDQQFGGRLRIRYNNFTAPFNFVQLN